MNRRRLQDPKVAARETRAAWDRAIDSWEDFQEQGKDFSRDDVHGPALLRAIGPLRGLDVLDLGCGQGRFTRELARRGARVVAVDWSRGMIAAARRHERIRPLGIRYLRADARTVRRRWKPASFDLVVGCMSFMDMPDLPRVLRAARTLVRPDGRLVFSVSHPMATAAIGWAEPEKRRREAMVVGDYFRARVGVTPWRMRRLKWPFDTIFWHRTLESWFALLDRSGFEIVGLREPRATAAQVRTNRLLRGSQNFPFFLVFDCRVHARRRGPGQRGDGP
jgi:2-polyprenyl-3-methyl-5-hydroxy-6-metoxy-1,4-benzoquinol methylase